jgi:hypothetical protein
LIGKQGGFAAFGKSHFTEVIELFSSMFRPAGPTKQISEAMKPFSAFGADIRKQPTVIRFQRNGGDAGTESGDRPMRTISFILAFAFILAGPSIAGSSDNGLPGIGTFSYNGSPATTPAPQPIVVAAK